MAGRIRAGVAGATGAVGGEIVALLGRPGSPVSEIVPMASMDSEVHQVVFAGGNVTVQNLHAEALERCDVVFFAVPRTVAAAHLAEALDAGVAVIDLSGALGPQVPRVVASVNRVDLERFDETRAVACPSAAVTLVATLLHPLSVQVRRLSVRGLLLQPASVRGRAGIRELSQQVVSLFNSREPEQRVFPQGLAFDVAPILGTPGPTGWSDIEVATSQEVAALLGLDASDVAITQIVAPWFNGLCLALHGVMDPPLGIDRVADLLSSAPDVHLSRNSEDVPRPRGSDGRLGVHVGRLRADPAGEGFHLWAAADALRWGAAGNAVAVMEALLEDGRIG
ncbi:MAG: NAD(P)-binding domain-containing protein [Deltaproteobacteria bacterium]|nr:NAD(P)-binding domain-containing protein [Deltaproteobacteria bacterium]